MVQMKDVFKVYENGTKALKGIDFTINDGEFVFLVGPSGSGKSTILQDNLSELNRKIMDRW